MFGLLSLPKLLLTAFLIAVVWYGFKWFTQRQANIERSIKNQRSRHNKPNYSENSEANIEDMLPCKNCGAFIAKGSEHRCG